MLGKLACLQGQSLASDKLVSWYCTQTGQEPSYTGLLEALAKTPVDRQRLLHSYWEATTAKEREEGRKQPTAAHCALAKLVPRGFVKVIITTNFDRLLEDALQQVGIKPTVLSAESQVRGAIPLTHMDCCIFKVNGDYQDYSSMRNTQKELAKYPGAINQLLDRIFDEYGLVVCGWSAVWDTALREAICRCPSRRFTTWWAVHGELENEAHQLIQQRQAECIRIRDANTFLRDLKDHVIAITEFAVVHPLTVDVAVDRMKRYLVEAKYRIRLADMIKNTVDTMLDQTTGDMFDTRIMQDTGLVQLDAKMWTHRTHAYKTASDLLLEIASIGGYWLEEDHLALWRQALDRLLTRPIPSHYHGALMNLHRLPGTLLLYSLGLGIVEAQRLWGLNALLRANTTQRHTYGGFQSAFMAIVSNYHSHAWETLQDNPTDSQTPFSDFIYEALQPGGQRLGLDGERYRAAFDHLELLMALHAFHLHHEENVQIEPLWPIRCFTNNHNWSRTLVGMEKSIEALDSESPYVKCQIFGSTSRACTDIMYKYQITMFDSVLCQ